MVVCIPSTIKKRSTERIKQANRTVEEKVQTAHMSILTVLSHENSTERRKRPQFSISSFLFSLIIDILYYLAATSRY